jgi:hypothetical protein
MTFERQSGCGLPEMSLFSLECQGTVVVFARRLSYAQVHG